MLTAIHPKLPMRSKSATKEFYANKLGFEQLGSADHDDYLMLGRDGIEVHFFLFTELDPKENYGQVYIRTNNVDELYQSFVDNKVPIHPNGTLATKPWRQREFSLLDSDNNLLTFGQGV